MVDSVAARTCSGYLQTVLIKCSYLLSELVSLCGLFAIPASPSGRVPFH